MLHLRFSHPYLWGTTHDAIRLKYYSYRMEETAVLLQELTTVAKPRQKRDLSQKIAALLQEVETVAKPGHEFSQLERVLIALIILVLNGAQLYT
ncbi:hypothetical protein VB741_08615 [Leptothoe sp. PORK10 BA2]|nr:hypothetical protein [Leptothoe sp. PORK10 BA2]